MREFLESVVIAGLQATVSVLTGVSIAFDCASKVFRIYHDRFATRHDEKYAPHAEEDERIVVTVSDKGVN